MALFSIAEYFGVDELGAYDLCFGFSNVLVIIEKRLFPNNDVPVFMVDISVSNLVA